MPSAIPMKQVLNKIQTCLTKSYASVMDVSPLVPYVSSILSVVLKGHNFSVQLN